MDNSEWEQDSRTAQPVRSPVLHTGVVPRSQLRHHCPAESGFFSYRETIAAYATGGGSYTVASQNLGKGVGLLPGAALMIHYTLNVAVGISAGMCAIVSVAPALQPHTLALCVAMFFILSATPDIGRSS